MKTNPLSIFGIGWMCLWQTFYYDASFLSSHFHLRMNSHYSGFQVNDVRCLFLFPTLDILSKCFLEVLWDTLSLLLLGSRALGVSGSRALGLSRSRACGLSESRGLWPSGSRALALSTSPSLYVPPTKIIAHAYQESAPEMSPPGGSNFS